jgi:uncharacterized protein (DUF305 family)
MHRNAAFRRIASGAAAVGAAVILSACGSQDTGTAGQSDNAAAAPAASQAATGTQASFNDADVAFVQMMIPDHQMTAEMAEMAEKKADSKDLKTLAAQMRKEQPAAVATLQGWLKAWGKPASSDMAGMDMPGAMSDKDMDMLDSMSGMEFDMMFAEMMIKHHEGSMQMARDEQANGASTEVKAMAADMLEQQQAEVQQLRKIADM